MTIASTHGSQTISESPVSLSNSLLDELVNATVNLAFSFEYNVSGIFISLLLNCSVLIKNNLINNVSYDKTWTWLRKGNFKRETESLLITAQNKAIRTNHIKARIDNTWQNIKCWQCCDRDETINHIISECSKLALKEYKIRNDWVGKVILLDMCKKFKFDHTYKWYMHNPAAVLENNTHKLQWDFDIHTDHWISARRPDLIIIDQKKKFKIVDFAVPVDHRIKLKECEKKDKYIDLASELKKLWNMQVTIIPIVIGAFGTVTEGLLKGLGGLGCWSGDCYEIAEGFRFMPLSLVRLRTFRLSTWVGWV